MTTTSTSFPEREILRIIRKVLSSEVSRRVKLVNNSKDNELSFDENLNIYFNGIYLILAIIFGIVANGFLKTTNGFTNLAPTIFCICSIVICIFFLSNFVILNLS